jgi:hypothetical protein
MAGALYKQFLNTGPCFRRPLGGKGIMIMYYLLAACRVSAAASLTENEPQIRDIGPETMNFRTDLHDRIRVNRS